MLKQIFDYFGPRNELTSGLQIPQQESLDSKLKGMCDEIVDFHVRRANYPINILVDFENRRVGERIDIINVDLNEAGLALIGDSNDLRRYIEDRDGIIVGFVELDFYYPVFPDKDVTTAREFIKYRNDSSLRMQNSERIRSYYQEGFRYAQSVDKLEKSVVAVGILLRPRNEEEQQIK